MKIQKSPHMEALHLVSDLLHNRVTRGEFVQRVKEFDSLYPNAGYFLTAANIETYYAEKGLPLNVTAGWRP